MFLVEILLEFLFELVVHMLLPYVFCLPGACVRWCFLVGEVPLKKLLGNYVWFNVFLSVLLYIGLFLLFILN